MVFRSFLLDVSPRCSSSAPIKMPPGSLRLREFSHSPVNGQRGFRIRLFWFPFHGLTHYQPPHECYNGLDAPTATKC